MSILISIIALITVGLVTRFAPINPLIGFAIGSGLGMILMLLVIRKLGKSAEKSLIAWEIFSKLSSYSVPSYTIRQHASKERNDNIDGDYKDIVTVLKDQMQFPPAKAKEAASYAISQIPNGLLTSKIKVALMYLGDGHKKVSSRR